MSDNVARIHLKIGDLEVEYEGGESFLRDDLSTILDAMAECLKEHGIVRVSDSPSDAKEIGGATHRDLELDLSTATIISRMNAETGPELAMAAATNLTLVENVNTFSRADILAAMKKATSYYKASMGSNLTGTLKRLVKTNRLNENAANVYALTVNEKKKMEELLV